MEGIKYDKKPSNPEQNVTSPSLISISEVGQRDSSPCSNLLYAHNIPIVTITWLFFCPIVKNKHPFFSLVRRRKGRNKKGERILVSIFWILYFYYSKPDLIATIWTVRLYSMHHFSPPTHHWKSRHSLLRLEWLLSAFLLFPLQIRLSVGPPCSHFGIFKLLSSSFCEHFIASHQISQVGCTEVDCFFNLELFQMIISKT